MNAKTLRVKGMHCASCAQIIEKTFKKIPGVHSAEVNYATETAKLSYDENQTNPEALSKKVEHLGYSLHSPTAEEMGMSASEHKRSRARARLNGSPLGAAGGEIAHDVAGDAYRPLMRRRFGSPVLDVHVELNIDRVLSEQHDEVFV